MRAAVMVIRRRLEKAKKDPDVVTVMSDGFMMSDVREWISTGMPELDVILGGGLPVGRSLEVYGPEAVGKSALLHRAIKGVQDVGGFAVVNDHERALDSKKMMQLKIDPERLTYVPADYIEQGLDVWLDLLEGLITKSPDAPVLFGFDSIAAAPPKQEFDLDSTESSLVGAQARAMKRVFRTITGKLPKARACAFFINQEIAAIGQWTPNPMMKPKTTPGGDAARYFASLRLRNQKIKTIKEGQISTGLLIRTTTAKARLVPPFMRSEWVIDFELGPSPELTTLHHLITTRQAKLADGLYAFSFSDERLTRTTFVDAMKLDPAFRVAAQAASTAAVWARQTGAPDPGDPEDLD